MLDAIKQQCQNYYNQIPTDTLPKIAKSALYTFTIGVITFKTNPGETINIARPLFNAGVAALASLIYALANPLFNMTFGDHEVYFHREIMKLGVVSVLTVVLACSATASKVNLTALPILFSALPINAIKAYCDLFPIIVNWFDKGASDAIKNGYKWLGIAVEQDSSSVFLVL